MKHTTHWTLRLHSMIGGSHFRLFERMQQVKSCVNMILATMLNRSSFQSGHILMDGQWSHFHLVVCKRKWQTQIILPPCYKYRVVSIPINRASNILLDRPTPRPCPSSYKRVPVILEWCSSDSTESNLFAWCDRTMRTNNFLPFDVVCLFIMITFMITVLVLKWIRKKY